MIRIGWLSVASLLAVLVLATATAQANLPDPYNSYCEVSFAQTYTGLYNPGQPRDCVTIVPNGAGETFAATGITIRLHVFDAAMNPIPYIEPGDMILWDPGLCICGAGSIADGPTDFQGMTTFSGTIRGGGYANQLSVLVQGILIATIPVKINSPDAPQASPCAVDASDLAAWSAARGALFGSPNYTLAMDFNEDGAIDASDLAFWSSARGALCP
jgi:hypothetical protein